LSSVHSPSSTSRISTLSMPGEYTYVTDLQERSTWLTVLCLWVLYTCVEDPYMLLCNYEQVAGA
jgi:hypothetical protein